MQLNVNVCLSEEEPCVRSAIITLMLPCIAVFPSAVKKKTKKKKLGFGASDESPDLSFRFVRAASFLPCLERTGFSRGGLIPFWPAK